MPLRKTDFSATRKFEDGQDWMVLRVGGLSKSEADHVRDLTAAYKLDARAAAGGTNAEQMASVEVEQRTAQANAALFETLCIEWSVRDDDGHPLPVTQDAYADLDEESGQWVDSCIAQVLRERRERAEKNVGTSRKPRARGSSSPKAAK